jgi:riboflavin biosynthesis pyrimidine reductase
VRRNIEGLKRSARLRGESTQQRALAALQRMETSDQEINFRTVAVEAGVSTAWLYSKNELRDRIVDLRKSQSHAASAASAVQCRERISRQNIVATLRLRIKKLEEKTRELTELLEQAYGVIAETRLGDSGIASG